MAVISRPTLPTETIIDILDVLFATGGGPVEAVCLSGVDTVMRDIVAARPTYWSSIVLDMNFSSVRLAHLCLKKSQKNTITLAVIFKAEEHLLGRPSPLHTEDVIRFIVTSGPRLKALTIHMETLPQHVVFRTALPRLSLPKLESLTLDYQSPSHLGSGNREITLPLAPHLRSLTLNGVTPNPLRGERFAHLTSLRLGAAPSFAWPAHDVAGIIRHATKLEELYLEGRADELATTTDKLWIRILGARALQCPNLRFLSIIHADECFAHEFLHSLTAPCLDTVQFLRPAKRSFHKEYNKLGTSASSVNSVRNLIIYYNPQATDIEFDPFGMFIHMTFTSITDLEIGTATTHVLASWALYSNVPWMNYWYTLERLKIHRTTIAKDEWMEGSPREALQDALDFVLLKKKMAVHGCQRIEELSLDTTEIERDDEVVEMMDALRREVEKVTFGRVEMTPRK